MQVHAAVNISCFKLLPCLCAAFPYMAMTPWMAVMLLHHSVIWPILIYNTSADMYSLKGIQLNLKQPKWVFKVVNNLEHLSKWIEQNPFFGLFLLKYFAPAILLQISSRVGGLFSNNCLFRSLASRQMQNVPFAFLGYINEDIQGVGALWTLSVLLEYVCGYVEQEVCLGLWLYGTYQACCLLCGKYLKSHLLNLV